METTPGGGKVATEKVVDLVPLQSVANEGAIRLVIVSEPPDGGVQARRVGIDTDLRDGMRRPLVRVARRLAQAEQMPFDMGFEPRPDQVSVIPVSDIAAHALLSSVLDIDAVPDLGESEDLPPNPVMYALVVDSKGVRATFLRKSGQFQLAKRRRLVGLLDRAQMKAYTGAVYTFDGQVDAVLFGDHLVVVNPAPFKDLFSDAAAIQAQFDQDVKTLNAQLPIANLKAFEDVCSKNPRMMTKLSRAMKRPYFPKLTLADLEDLIQRKGLDPGLVDPKGNLVFDGDIQRRWTILKMLDDDYLESKMTSSDYEVNSKIAL